MLGFIKKRFVGLLNFFVTGCYGESLISNLKGPIKCLSLNNHSCQATLIKLFLSIYCYC